MPFFGARLQTYSCAKTGHPGLHPSLNGATKRMQQLASSVEWHMREGWQELMFAETGQAAKATRNPVALAQLSDATQHKAEAHVLPSGMLTPAEN